MNTLHERMLYTWRVPNPQPPDYQSEHIQLSNREASHLLSTTMYIFMEKQEKQQLILAEKKKSKPYL